MKTSPDITSRIKEKFQNLHTKEDLLCLLNFVKPIVYGEKAKPFNIKQLTWYYISKKDQSKYYSFSIKKKSGDYRTIHAPIAGLKAIQKTLAYILETVHEPHESACGFRKGSSIIDNAAKHVGSRYVYNIDLKDFFPSIDQARIWKCLQLPPFSLKDKASVSVLNLENPEITIMNKIDGETIELTHPLQIRCMYNGLNFLNGTWETNCENYRIGYYVTVNNKKRDAGFIQIDLKDLLEEIFSGTNKIKQEDINVYFEAIIKHQQALIDKIPKHTAANMIAKICCTEMEVDRMDEKDEWIKTTRNVLPQGAPTSPVITNIICKRLDRQLTGLAKRFGLKYSRYADDITFSSEHNVYQKDSTFNEELFRIVKNQRFHIKDSKTRLQKEGHRQEVTGLLVNKKINVQKRYIKQLRTWIHLLEKYNYHKAASIILSHHHDDKGHVIEGNMNIKHVIRGKLAYLKMVKGSTNPQYIGLNNRFKIAISQNKDKSGAHTLSFGKEAVSINIKAKTNDVKRNNIVDAILEKGLDEAMEKFNTGDIF